MKQKGNKSKCRINKIEVTQDTLTGRGGMAPFVRYIEKVGICNVLLSLFGYIRKSKKGASIEPREEGQVYFISRKGLQRYRGFTPCILAISSEVRLMLLYIPFT